MATSHCTNCGAQLGDGFAFCAECGAKQPSGLGFVEGRHYTEHVEAVSALVKDGSFETAERLLLQLVKAVEAESADTGWGAAPWYCERLAVIYRKQKDFASEVANLERFGAQPHGPGAMPEQLAKRLAKARQLRERAARR